MSSMAFTGNSFGKYNIPTIKKKKASSLWSKIICLALIIMSVLTILFISDGFKLISLNLFERERNESALDVNHYKMLLARAKELSEKYKQLTGASSLPQDLQFHHEDPSSGNSDSFKSLGDDGKLNKVTAIVRDRDLVLGMAKDIDPKNLVSYILLVIISSS